MLLGLHPTNGINYFCFVFVLFFSNDLYQFYYEVVSILVGGVWTQDTDWDCFFFLLCIIVACVKACNFGLP